MIYHIEVLPRARRDLKSIPPNFIEQIDEKIKSLGSNPRPHGYEKLEGDDQCRVRSGDYRIVYGISDRERMVYIGHVGHRREVYRNL